MKNIAVVTTHKELKEFQERTDIRILDINVKACDQTFATQEYFVATIVYDDDLNSDPDYWTRLEHQYAGITMQSILQTMPRVSEPEKYMKAAIDLSVKIAHSLVEKYKNEETL